MKEVCRAAQVRARDQAVISELKMPGRVLMELAGHAAAVRIHAERPGARVAVLCGPGNNGADGFVVARWLRLWGHAVQVWCSGPPRTPDGQSNLALLGAMDLGPTPELRAAVAGAEVVVDALLGTGQRSGPRGAIAQAVDATRQARSAGATVVALDLPTGICADTGACLGGVDHVVHAHHTVTFGYWKAGLLCMPGAALAGSVQVVDIGLDLAARVSPEHGTPFAELLEAPDVRAWLHTAQAHHAKWNRGHVAVRAGGGAAVLACHGALATGAGLVTLLAPRHSWPALHGLDPAVILAPPEALDPRRHDALVLGPGIGTDATAEVGDLWQNAAMPVLADADALTILAQADLGDAPTFPRVITPHAAEAARLLRCTRTAVESDRFGAVDKLSPWGLAVLKGPHTLIGSAPTWVSPVADGRLAIAGSGDVLAGCIATGLAQGRVPRHAAALGVWLHGAAAAFLPTHASASHLPDAIRAASAELTRLPDARPTPPAPTASGR